MENIILVKMGKSNAYLIKTLKGFIMIDAGVDGKTNEVKKVLDTINADLAHIKLIIITHVHYDHVGSLYEIKNKSGAQVLVHENEKDDLMRGYTRFPKGTMMFSKIVSTSVNQFSRAIFKPVEPDITIKDVWHLDDYGIEGKVIHTPGHTKGSLCVIIKGKYCFTGDTMTNIFPNTVYPPFANDEALLLKSWAKIKNHGCEKYFPGHGKVFDKAKFEDSYKKAKSL